MIARRPLRGSEQYTTCSWPENRAKTPRVRPDRSGSRGSRLGSRGSRSGLRFEAPDVVNDGDVVDGGPWGAEPCASWADEPCAGASRPAEPWSGEADGTTASAVVVPAGPGTGDDPEGAAGMDPEPLTGSVGRLSPADAVASSVTVVTLLMSRSARMVRTCHSTIVPSRSLRDAHARSVERRPVERGRLSAGRSRTTADGCRGGADVRPEAAFLPTGLLTAGRRPPASCSSPAPAGAFRSQQTPMRERRDAISAGPCRFCRAWSILSRAVVGPLALPEGGSRWPHGRCLLPGGGRVGIGRSKACKGIGWSVRR